MRDQLYSVSLVCLRFFKSYCFAMKTVVLYQTLYCPTNAHKL